MTYLTTKHRSLKCWKWHYFTVQWKKLLQWRVDWTRPGVGHLLFSSPPIREFGIKKKTVLMPGGLRLLFLKGSSFNELRAAFCFSSTGHVSGQFRRHASAVLSSNLILTLKSKRHQEHIWGRLFRDYLRFARRTNWTIRRGCMWFTRLTDVIIQFMQRV